MKFLPSSCLGSQTLIARVRALGTSVIECVATSLDSSRWISLAHPFGDEHSRSRILFSRSRLLPPSHPQPAPTSARNRSPSPTQRPEPPSTSQLMEQSPQPLPQPIRDLS